MNKGRLLIRLSSLNAVGFYMMTLFLAGFGYLKGHDDPGFGKAALCLLLMNSGFLMSWLVNRKATLTWKLIGHTVVPGVAAAASPLFLSGVFIEIYMAIFLVLFYFVGFRSGSAADYSILNNKRIYVGIGVCTVCLALSFYIGSLRHLFPVQVLLTSLFSILSMIVANQKTLDYNIYVKRGVDPSGVQKKLRSYNIKIVLLLALIIVVLFNIKVIVMKAYSIVGFIAGRLIYYIYLAIIYLFSQSDTGNGKSASPGDMMQLPAEEGGSSIVPIILTILIAILFVFLAVKYLPSLVKAIFKKVKSFFCKIALFIKSFFTSKEVGMKLEFEEFADHIEIIRTGPALRRKVSRPGASLRRLKSMEDPILKIRHLYRTIINYYRDIIEIKKSDTAGEILKKSEKLESMRIQFGKITHGYEKARYGNIPPTEDFIKESENFARNSLKRF